MRSNGLLFTSHLLLLLYSGTGSQVVLLVSYRYCRVDVAEVTYHCVHNAGLPAAVCYYHWGCVTLRRDEKLRFMCLHFSKQWQITHPADFILSVYHHSVRLNVQIK